MDPLSLHTSMRNKQVEFNPYIYTLLLYQNCTVLATKYPIFNTKHPVIILRASLFVVTPAHVYRSRKHWECKYLNIKADEEDITYMTDFSDPAFVAITGEGPWCVLARAIM